MRDSSAPYDALVGLRMFCVYRNGLLGPVNSRFEPWLPGDNEAYCEHAADGVPHRARSGGFGCPGHCGFNAVHFSARAHLYHPAGGGDRDMVGAVVVGWGDVEVHHDGWRSQHAQVVAVIEPSGEQALELARKACRAYQVPLVNLAHAEQVALEHGRHATAGEPPPAPDDDRRARAIPKPVLVAVTTMAVLPADAFAARPVAHGALPVLQAARPCRGRARPAAPGRYW